MTEPTNLDATPIHVAIIMDGNGRWAAAKGLERIEGHRQGARAVRTAIESSIKYGIRYLTLYSFSSENWKRPNDEVNDLMELLKYYLKSEIDELNSNNIRLRVIGDRNKLSAEIVKLIEKSEAMTSNNQSLDLIIAISYGAHEEILMAAKKMAKEVQLGRKKIDDITEKNFAKALYTENIPDPDLLIRTSGEKRISNFLLWQLAYSELVFLDTLWPDFSEKDFSVALSEFQTRERRFGNSRSLT